MSTAKIKPPSRGKPVPGADQNKNALPGLDLPGRASRRPVDKGYPARAGTGLPSLIHHGGKLRRVLPDLGLRCDVLPRCAPGAVMHREVEFFIPPVTHQDGSTGRAHRWVGHCSHLLSARSRAPLAYVFTPTRDPIVRRYSHPDLAGPPAVANTVALLLPWCYKSNTLGPATETLSQSPGGARAA